MGNRRLGGGGEPLPSSLIQVFSINLIFLECPSSARCHQFEFFSFKKKKTITVVPKLINNSPEGQAHLPPTLKKGVWEGRGGD